jgi:hypothetical protein
MWHDAVLLVAIKATELNISYKYHADKLQTFVARYAEFGLIRDENILETCLILFIY